MLMGLDCLVSNVWRAGRGKAFLERDGLPLVLVDYDGHNRQLLTLQLSVEEIAEHGGRPSGTG